MKRSGLGVSDWRAYAYFRAARKLGARESQRAKLLYRRALRLDPAFRAARVNLARLIQGESKGKDDKDPLDQSRKLLDAVRTDVFAESGETGARIRKDADLEDTSLYTALYLLVGLNQELGDIAAARKRAAELLKLIDHVRRKKRYWFFSQSADLLGYVRSMERQAKIMHHGLAALSDEEDAFRELETLSDEYMASPHALTQYNLACAFTLAANRRERYAAPALEHLSMAVALRPSLAAWSRDDTLMEWLRIHRRERYDEIAPAPERAPEIPDADPSPGPLAEVPTIGAAHAAALAERKIDDHEDLLAQVATPDARTRLAESLGLARGLIDRWARLADLLRIVGIRPAQLSLLTHVGIDSLDDLEAADAAGLTAMLQGAAPTLDATAPDRAEVASWIRQARELSGLVA